MMTTWSSFPPPRAPTKRGMTISTSAFMVHNDTYSKGIQDLTQHVDAAEHLSNLSGVELVFESTNEEDEDDDDDEDEDEDEEGAEGEEEGEEEEEEEEGEGARRPIYITRDQIMQLLGHAGLGRIFTSDFTTRAAARRVRVDEDDEEESDPGTGYDAIGPRSSRRARRARGEALYEKVPSERGQELMNGGLFGSNARQEDTLKRKKRLAYNILQRELGLGGEGRQKNATRLMKQNMLPESVADTIIHYNARCYSGQFSDDGNFFFSCAQDFRVRMYDTSNPYDWKYYKVGG